MSNIIRALNDEEANTTSFTQQQNRGVLIAGLTCACFSVLATLVTLRWFILMKRTFRHKLIMFLIFSDTFKAFWYFLFPVVVFSRGPVQASSGFCQASGFFLSIGIEASDFAILMIALHSLLYIFHPPARSGDQGGMYRWRKFMYPCWVVLPILAAALAFVNSGNAYTTAGTFCYLPRRPIWYRLALSWIPRYFVMGLIFSMYTAVYVYVTLKFRSFSNLQESESNYSSSSHSRRSSMSMDDIAPEEPSQPPDTTKRIKMSRPMFSRSASYNQQLAQVGRELDPWDEVSFITSRPLKKTSGWQPGIQTSDFAFNQENPSDVNGTVSSQSKDLSLRMAASAPGSRRPSNVPTTSSSSYTGETAISTPQPPVQPAPKSHTMPKPSHAHSQSHSKPKDPLKRTRKAIRKQLRYLFIYPAVYVFMWIFPFVSHCLLYDDYYVQNPIYWLTVVSTCMFSLQAGVDCVVFSWREKPWRRIPEGRKFSLQSFRSSLSMRQSTNKKRSTESSVMVGPNEEHGDDQQNGMPSGLSSRATSNHWWEAEGRARKDSVWMGTDSSGGVDQQRRDTVVRASISAPALVETEEEHEHHANGHPPETVHKMHNDSSSEGS